MRSWWVWGLAWVVAVMLSAGVASAEENWRILRETPAGIGEFTARVTPGADLRKGDIVQVQRDGVPVGEATVMRADADGTAVVSLRGDFAVRPGDRLVFLRRPTAVQVAVSSQPGRTAGGGTLCWLCSTPSPETVYLAGVSMEVCPRCMQVEVVSPALVDTLYREVREVLEQQWDFVVRPAPNLDLGVLQSSLLGKYERWNRKMTVNAGQRLPALMGVIAHEYAHAWHHKVNPGLSNQLVTEGFATWVEYHFFRTLGQPGMAEEMLEGVPATPYLSGFRMMQDFEARRGAGAVFRAVATYED